MVEEHRRTKQLRDRERDKQRHRDRQNRDESAMRAHLCYKAAKEAHKAYNNAIRQRKLAEAEKRRLIRFRERE
jgi:hypothetical protein